MSTRGFIKFQRSENARELLKKPKCFALLALIAQRARRSGELTLHDLRLGEALIGDCDAVGLTEQEYRTAKKTLERLGLATFTGTSRGTVARLLDDTVFDINAQAGNGRINERVTDGQRTANGQATTNKNGKKEKNEKNVRAYEAFKLKFISKASMSQPSYEEIRRCR